MVISKLEEVVFGRFLVGAVKFLQKYFDEWVTSLPLLPKPTF
jgi:hypothetical protein